MKSFLCPAGYKLLFFLLVVLGASACQKDLGDTAGDSDEDYGRLRIELTDAPSDDPDISTVYITLAGVAINDLPLEQLSVRQTVDISNFTGGNTIQLGADQLVQAGQYTELTFIIDLDNDAPGNGPGCFVELLTGQKDPLGYGAGKAMVTIPVSFNVPLGGQTRLIADIDLRKAIHFDVQTGDYQFASEVELAKSIRVVDAARTGGIEGRITGDDPSTGGVRLIYAFPAGQVNLNLIKAGIFEASVTSGRASASGSFKLSFLPAGGYELLAVDYADPNGDGRLELQGARSSDVAIGAVTRSVVVSAGAQVSATLSLGGLLP